MDNLPDFAGAARAGLVGLVCVIIVGIVLMIANEIHKRK